ncbi:MAG: multidrug efflux SMR transporter [Candidatus Azobacteroides sp.]|nr:multidrug efflux SMR transporter [Candidatus Azobacteroides sp.]
MAWLYLVLAGLSEIIWAYGLKASHGFTVLNWSIITVTFMLVSFYLLGRAIRQIPIGTSYAVFTGIGAVGTAIIAMMFLNESADGWKIISLLVLITGIIGLKLVDNKTPEDRKEGKK